MLTSPSLRVALALATVLMLPGVIATATPTPVRIAAASPTDAAATQAPSHTSTTPQTAFGIVIDPGHGGTETGAAGKSGIFEKEITLDIAKRLKGLLEKEPGLIVLLTREDDSLVGLDERTALANQNHADLFLSIHVNSSQRRDARGAETYFLSSSAKDEEIRTLAAIENNAAGVKPETLKGPDASHLEMILWDLAQTQYLEASSALAEAIQGQLDDALGVRDRGVRQAPFRVLMGATMPAVLVEVGFISNPSEETNLKSDAYRDSIASALSRAVVAFRADAAKRLAGAPAQTR